MLPDKSQFTVLIVDDDDEIRYSLGRVLGSQGYSIVPAGSGEEAIEKIKSGLSPDLVFMDIRMGGITGIETLQHMRSLDSNLQIILMTAFGTAQTAIEAMKFGAHDYIMKPFDVDKVLGLAEAAISAANDLKTADSYEVKVNSEDYKDGIVGNSPAMQEVFKIIGQVAASDATVLITGESGTGKELIANCIYKHSLRSGGPFVAVNCAAIPDNLIESELFGHEKGAFTGATTQRIGKFEQCDRGTIFLDEIGDMALATQTKILRAVQSGEIQRVGGTETITVNVRLIAATNKDLEKMVEEKTFREDLYYRLNVFRIKLPSLVERREDIQDIVDYMLQSLLKERKAKAKKVTADAMNALVSYDWPGNVRELGNVVYHSAVVAQGDTILLKDLPSTILQAVGSIGGAAPAVSPTVESAQAVDVEKPRFDPYAVTSKPAKPVVAEVQEKVSAVESILPQPQTFVRSLPETYDFLYGELKEQKKKRILSLIEKEMIERAIEDTGGNQARAAEILGITRNTLKKRLDEYAGR
ncbi:sigma-54 dependent transcriptional regulator [Puniceicoccaceae bacterium K14]|nr:sigma-54 dependent transcriptional regulator [Puniceicoccaceae bacterium K14]